MSRVIVSRHEDGSERVVLGHDGALGYFAHEYAPLADPEPGHLVRQVGDLGGINKIDELAYETGFIGITVCWTSALREALKVRTPNAIIDLSEAAP